MNIQQFAYPIARYRGENDSSSQEINYPAASGRGMPIVLLPNRRFGLQSDFFAASSGECTPTRFNAQFQNFAHRVSILCALHTGGKISTSQTYQHMLTLYEQLQPYLSLIADSSPCDLSNGFAASYCSDDGTLHNT